MKRLFGGVLALVLLAGSAGQTRGAVVFSNFGPGDAYNTNVGWTIAGPDVTVGVSQGDAFTASGTGALSQIRIAIGRFAGTNEFLLDLRADAGGTPGAILEHFDIVGQMPLFDNTPHPPVAVN